MWPDRRNTFTLVVGILSCSIWVTAAAFPRCTLSVPLACYNDSAPRPVSYLAGGDIPTMTVQSCGLLCTVDGFTVVGATGNPAAGYCYCGAGIDPKAQVVANSFCNITCPGNRSENCGGVGFTRVYNMTCDGPLPPQPVGPPLPFGRACSQAATRGWRFCNVSLSLDERVADLVARIALSEIGPQLTSRESPAIPRLGLPGFYWGCVQYDLF